MRIGRLGPIGQERPAIFVEDDHAVFVDHLVDDWSRDTIAANAVEIVRSADLSSLPRVALSDYRIGSPVARPTKIVCIGLNYARHAAEAGLETPTEPVIFMKAPDTCVGPYDDIVIPPNSTATDYEVELAIVIGRQALYLPDPAAAGAYILGFSISQDVSERHWQTERSGQWVKGKSFPTFNPLGPCIVTPDELNVEDLRIWCTVDGQARQDSRTDDMIFNVGYIVWYVSQVMELFPGDLINTGTPAGVGLGFDPPRYLRPGEVVVTGIEGIGEIRSVTVSYLR